MNLRAALLGCSTGQLTRIAAAWQLAVEAGTLRRELVDAVAARIEDGLDDSTLWATLGPDAVSVLQVLARAGGRHEADLLTRRLVRAAEPGSTPDPDAPDPAADVEQAVSLLLERGLLVRTFSAEEQQRGIYLVAPDEVLSAVRQPLAAAGAPVDGLAARAAPDLMATGNLAGDLFVLASALRREAWGAASRGLAGRPARSVDQILARLRRLPCHGPGDPARRWRFLLWVAQRAGWITRDRQPVPADDQIERLLADPAALPSQALAAGPVATDGASASPAARSGARQRQADALQFLSELGYEQWWDAAVVAEWLAETLAEPVTADLPLPDRARIRLEAQVTRWLAGRWFWLGLVEWGQVQGRWTVVRPTQALRSLMSGRTMPSGSAAPPAEPCVASGNDRFELIAPPSTDLQRLYQAERYLAYGGGGGTEPRRYGLTPASIDRGLRLGGDAEELHELLERLTHAPLPVSWTAAIQRWLDEASRLRLRPALVLSSARPEVLAEALSLPLARDAMIEQPSPRHALIGGGHVAALLAELAQAGLPVDVDAGLRAEPADPRRAAALANGVAETAWVALEVLRRLAPDVAAEQRDLAAARGHLDAVLPAGLVESLSRRAASIVAAMGQRKRPPARSTSRRVV